MPTRDCGPERSGEVGSVAAHTRLSRHPPPSRSHALRGSGEMALERRPGAPAPNPVRRTAIVGGQAFPVRMGDAERPRPFAHGGPCARAVGVVGAVGGEQTLPAVCRATPLRLAPMLRVGAQRRRSCAIIRTSCRPSCAEAIADRLVDAGAPGAGVPTEDCGHARRSAQGWASERGNPTLCT